MLLENFSYKYSQIFQKVLLNPLGLDKESKLVFWLTLIFVSLFGVGVLITKGDIYLVAFVSYMVWIFLISFIRIDFSLYIFMAGVMFLDQYPIPNFPSRTEKLGFFSNLKEIDYIPFFEAGMVSPAELHLIFLALSLALYSVLRIDIKFKPIPAFIPYLMFYGAMLFSVAYGLSRSGDFMISLWEVRALFYLALIVIIVSQVVSTKRHVRNLIWIFIAGSTFKAFQGVLRFIELGFTTGGYEVLTNHEDAVFIVTILLLLLGFMIYGTHNKQRKVIMYMLPIILLGFYVAQRRASYASLIVSISLLIVILDSSRRTAFLKYFIPVVVALFVYGAVFWNSSSTLARPVQIIKSGIEKPDLETNAADYYSNLYREIENYNLSRTVVNNPLIGVGFGRKYEQPIPLVNIRFPLKDYIPHNEILWIFVKMGMVGFFAFWFYFNAVAAKATQLFTRLKDPYLKAVMLMITLSVINQMVVSFFDLQLTYYRNMLYLGCLIGLIPAIEYVASTEEEGAKEEDPEQEATDE